MVGFSGKKVQLRDELLGLQKAVVTSGPGEISRIAAAEIDVLTGYYNTILTQATANLRWALIAAGASLGCLAAASVLRLIGYGEAVSLVKGGGLLSAGVSGLLFFIYARLSVQLAAFHQSLEGLHRFLLAGNLCSALSGEAREKAWADLASCIAAPTQRTAAVEAILGRFAGNRTP